MNEYKHTNNNKCKSTSIQVYVMNGCVVKTGSANSLLAWLRSFHSLKCFHLPPPLLPHYLNLSLLINLNNTENLKNQTRCFISCPTYVGIHDLMSSFSTVWTSVLLPLCGLPCWHLLLHPRVRKKV